MRHSVSATPPSTATTSPATAIVTEETEKAMQKLLDEVKDGTFAKNWIAENRNGRPWFSKRRAAESELQIESVGREMRRMMPFLDAKEVLPGLRGAQAAPRAGGEGGVRRKCRSRERGPMTAPAKDTRGARLAAAEPERGADEEDPRA